jgi:hypothetical protein
VFAALFRMHPACPECGLRFEGEPGCFLGAMYCSYAIAVAAATPPAIAAWIAGWSPATVSLAALAAIRIASPLAFRLSRVLRLHMDQALDPR